MPLALVTEFAFTADVAVGAALVIEGVPNGVRRYIPITGGSVDDPLLNGKVLAAGGDSHIVRADGNRGLRHGPTPIMSQLSRGSRYEDFNKSLFVATGERKSNSVVMHFYRVR